MAKEQKEVETSQNTKDQPVVITQEQFTELLETIKKQSDKIQSLEKLSGVIEEKPLAPQITEEEKQKKVSEILEKLKNLEEEENLAAGGFPLSYGDFSREYHTLTGKEYTRQVNKYIPK